MASGSVTPDTAYANAGLAYGPMPKRKVSEAACLAGSKTCGYYSNLLPKL